MNLLLFNLKTDADDDVLGFTIDWINALAEYFDQIFVITMCAGRISIRENVLVFSVGKEKGYSKIRRIVEFYRILSRLLTHRNIDACFSHMMPLFAVLGWPLLRIKRIPVVLWYAHGHTPVMLRIAEKLVDGIVTSSKEGCRLESKKITVVGQGIDIDRYSFHVRRKNTDMLHLLYVGRISPVKGILQLIEALAFFKKKVSQKFTLTVVGSPLTRDDEAYYREVQDAVKRYSLEEIRFTGPVPHNKVASFYKDCDIFINPSSTGSMDKAVLEAMASGALVITGNNAFDNEAFRSAGGFFSDNDPDNLCNALIMVSSLCDDEIQTRSRGGHAWVAGAHSLTSLVSKIVDEISRHIQHTCTRSSKR